MEISNPNVAQKPRQDDVMEISKPNVAEKPIRKPSFATETVIGIVDTKHIRKPSQQKKSPVKLP
jgi:hypothetical protein